MGNLPENFAYPSTRYSGSKRRLLPWLWHHLKPINFDSVLDVFGGTASVSLLFKLNAKKVHYNDLLLFNQIIGKAVVENKGVRVSNDELTLVLTEHNPPYPDFIQSEFDDVFFTQEENAFLDRVVSNISMLLDDEYKRAIVLAALFQSCLSKRPYNLFHRANYYMRTAAVERTFGNKTTWDKPFPFLMHQFVKEYNNAVFDNGRENCVIGGQNALSAPNGVDLVYLDPPYVSKEKGRGTDYLDFYHFLEGLSDYKGWPTRINRSKQHKPMVSLDAIDAFASRNKIIDSFEALFSRFHTNTMVLSYQSDGVPSRNEIIELLVGLRKNVEVHAVEHQYALSKNLTNELLFIAY